jgi:hypothetical protein
MTTFLSLTHINQIGLVLGFLGSIILAFSGKVGVISKNGAIVFTGLDSINSAEANIRHVKQSHWRNRFFTPFGWGLLSASFFLQFFATVM